MSSKSEIMQRIRAALADDPAAVEARREYHTHGPHPAGVTELINTFAERLADYRAHVHRADGSRGPASLIDEALRTAGSQSVVVPHGLPASWVPSAARISSATGMGVTALDHTDATVTGCALAIAETGTIVLDGGADQGRRAISLIPDHHVCLVRDEQIVGTVPEALALLDPLRPLTFISGPSATSDIELERVEGVHGPRRLDVVLS